MPRVIVAGSINQDVMVTVDRSPNPGETPSGTSFIYGLGGKGANQAAVAVHSGVPALFVGAVGADPSGQRLRVELASYGVDVTHLYEADGLSETALVTVNSPGENTIILDAGANATMTVEPAKASLLPVLADIVVLQAEILAEANAEALARVHSFGACILLNLVPACPTDVIFMARVDVLVVNETEAGLTLGMPVSVGPTEATGVAQALRGPNPKHVMVTLGVNGVVWASGSEARHFPTLTLGEAVDTIGTGDVCVGTLVAAVALGKPFAKIAADGIRVGSTAVLAPGATPSCAALPRVMRA